MMETISESSGNVFADLGFSAEESTLLAMRAELMARACEAIDNRGLSTGISPTPTPRIAAVVPNGSADFDATISAFARDLIAQGWRVRGLLQEFQAAGPNCEVTLVDLADGTRYGISQRLGSESTACRLDPGALAEASVVMRRIAGEGADLAIFNRFAAMEAGGDGLAAEMLEVMSGGIPVLTVVPPKHLAAWRHFTGGLAAELPPERAALDRWFRALHGG